MAELSASTQKRISILSLISAPTNSGTNLDDAYDEAVALIERMEEDGLFKEERSSGNGRSGGGRSSGGRTRSSSGGRSSNSRGRGSSSRSSGDFNNLKGGITDKQIDKILSLTDEYSESELEEMSKQEASDLIDSLI